jgi:hypothetical protein
MPISSHCQDLLQTMTRTRYNCHRCGSFRGIHFSLFPWTDRISPGSAHRCVLTVLSLEFAVIHDSRRIPFFSASPVLPTRSLPWAHLCCRRSPPLLQSRRVPSCPFKSAGLPAVFALHSQFTLIPCRWCTSTPGIPSKFPFPPLHPRNSRLGCNLLTWPEHRRPSCISGTSRLSARVTWSPPASTAVGASHNPR